MGPDKFGSFPWSQERVRNFFVDAEKRIPMLRSCTECGLCEARCPHGLPIMKMLKDRIVSYEDMLRILKEHQP